MTDGSAFLQLDQLAEGRQARRHLGIRLPQRGLLDGTLDKLAGKGCVRHQSGVAAVGRLIVAVVIVGSRRGSRYAAARVGGAVKGDWVQLQFDGESRRGYVLQESLDVAESAFDGVNFSFTGGEVSTGRAHMDVVPVGEDCQSTHGRHHQSMIRRDGVAMG